MVAYLTGLVRHAATLFGGYFAASADDVAQLVGAIVAVVGVAWSMIDKWLSTKA
jgi:hypothetical protein